MRLTLSSLLLATLLAFAVSAASAGELRLDGNFVQSGFVTGTTEPGSTVTLEDRPVRVSDSGRFVFGFGHEAPASALLTVRFPDGSTEEKPLSIGTREYETQRIDGLPPKMVTPPKKVLERIRTENARIAELRKSDRPEPLFESGFIWPVIGPISGVFGSRRILNGIPKQPHFGVDVAMPKGTAIRAPADAVVTLAQPDLYYTGGTVILDHGHGLTSVYSHMQELWVKEGQRLRQGEQIGSIGATGRVTGAHLDWRINWFDQRLDPALIVGPMPKAD